MTVSPKDAQRIATEVRALPYTHRARYALAVLANNTRRSYEDTIERYGDPREWHYAGDTCFVGDSGLTVRMA